MAIIRPAHSLIHSCPGTNELTHTTTAGFAVGM
jgi:hypothetical protein